MSLNSEVYFPLHQTIVQDNVLLTCKQCQVTKINTKQTQYNIIFSCIIIQYKKIILKQIFSMRVNGITWRIITGQGHNILETQSLHVSDGRRN
jgi:hypothetical protein